jgi:predicted transcriptional regulator
LKATISDFVIAKNKDGSIDKVATIRRAELYKKILKSEKILADIQAKERKNKIAKSLLAVAVLVAVLVLLWFMGG